MYGQIYFLNKARLNRIEYYFCQVIQHLIVLYHRGIGITAVAYQRKQMKTRWQINR